jgi:DNA-binding transcriptional MerR regulator
VSKKLFYKIGEACKLLDIQPYVLRYWETEFPFLSPGKSKSGQRVYSAKEIEIIRRIKALLYDEGYTIAGAKKRLESDLPGILQSDSIDDLEIDEEVLVARLKAPAAEAAAPAEAAPPTQPALAPTAVPAAEPIAAAATVPLESAVEAAHPVLDSGSALTIKTLRAGIQHALGEAKAILALLETPAGDSKRSSAARR